MKGFEAIIKVLADRPVPLKVFFRDDDAGWADERLQQLIAEFVSQDLPLDIAVIPEAISDRSAEVINRAFEMSDKISIHQHGFAHTNHQLSGRSSEFGSDRNYHQQLRDIAAGQSKMAEVFGSRSKPIFTPPWNRCSKDTATALQSLDVKFLSRITGSQPIDTDLSELPVSIDWLKKRNGVRLGTTELVEYMCPRLATDDPIIGVMLHHEHMDLDNRKLLQRFIVTLRESQKVSFHTMLEAAALITRRGRTGRSIEPGNVVAGKV